MTFTFYGDGRPTMSIDRVVEKFVGLLDEELALYDELLVVLQREKSALVNSQLFALNECTKEKESIILKIRVLDEQRIYFLTSLAELLECPADVLTLTRLSELIPEPYATQLQVRQKNLETIVLEIQRHKIQFHLEILQPCHKILFRLNNER